MCPNVQCPNGHCPNIHCPNVQCPNNRECLSSCITLFEDAIPWGLLLKKLKVVDSEGLVNYDKFLKMFRVEFRPGAAKHANWRLETVQQVGS